MKFRFRFNIQVKMLVFILSTTIIIFTLGIGYISLRFKRNALEDAKKVADSFAREYANLIKSYMDEDFAIARTMTNSFVKIDNIDKSINDEFHLKILYNITLSKKEYFASFLQWEYKLIDTTYKKNHGRLRKIFVRKNFKSDSLTYMEGVVDTVDYNPENPYYLSRKNRKEYIINPYFFSYDNAQEMPSNIPLKNNSVLETTIIIPIIKNDKFLGIAGFDVPLYEFQQIIKIIKPFKNSDAYIIANNGSFVAHPSLKNLGKSVSEIYPIANEKHELIKRIKNGKTFSFTTNKNSITNKNQDMYFTFAPIKMGNTDMSWTIGIVVPIKVIMEDANKHFYISIVVGFVGLIVLTIIIWLISKSISYPIIKTTSVFKSLAQGNINNDMKLIAKTNDELGDMTISANKLISGLNSISKFANKIGEGDLNADYKLLSEQDSLGKSLIDMREKLKNSKKTIELKNIELEKLSLVARKIDNSVVIMDKQGNFEWANMAFTIISGYEFEEFRDKFGSNLIDASFNPNINEVIEKCINGKKAVDYITLTETKNEDKIWVQSTLSPILSDNKDVLKLVVIDSDISEIKRTEQKVKDSIYYARQIQEAVLPSKNYIKKHFADSFILYKPKDVVSGDFFWARKVNNKDNKGNIINEILLIAVADCTGHGVPGAFMSMLGISLLNQIVNRYIYEHKTNNIVASDILDQLRFLIKKSLKQRGKRKEAKEGIDMTLLVINLKTHEAQFSGAYNTLYWFKNEYNNINFKEIKGDKMPIGIFLNEKKHFSNYKFQLNKNDTLYMFSDGYADQFGGKKGRKYLTHRFRSMIENIYKHSMEVQENILETELKKWKGENEQIDDILIMGIKI